MAIYTVTSAADSGSGTLRQAINDAGIGDTIEFASSISIITLTSGELTINKNLTIKGPGAEHLTISGNKALRAFHVSLGVDVTIQEISIKSCNQVDGGGIYNEGTLTIANSTLSGNTAGGYGGAIYNQGALTITNSMLIGNIAINDSGGAIYNKGSLTITNSTLLDNVTRADGGAIFSSGTITMTNSTLSGNTAVTFGGNIYNKGTLTITNSTLSSATSYGGTVFNMGTITITNSTLSSNTARYGGAIYNHDILTIANSTLSGNTAIDDGGAIYNDGILKVSFITITENKCDSGAGICNTQSTVKIKNSIIANNIGGNYYGSNQILALGVNFDTDGTCPSFTRVTSDALKLGPLALNDPGKTNTCALSRGSVAIDSVTDCTDVDGNAVTTDQRGVSRSQLICDAGSYEYRAPIPRGITVGVNSYGLKAKN